MALSRSAAAWHSSRYWRAPELVVSIEEQCDAANAWHDEHQELEALCREVHCHVRQAGDIAPRPGEARDELAAHRIGHRDKDDRYRLRGPLAGESGGAVDGDQHVDLRVVGKLRGKADETLRNLGGKAVFKDNVLPFDQTNIAQALP